MATTNRNGRKQHRLRHPRRFPVPVLLGGAPGGCAPSLTTVPVGPHPASSSRAFEGICDSTSSMSPSRSSSGRDHASLFPASESGSDFPTGSPSRSTLRSAPDAMACTASLIQSTPPDCVNTAGDTIHATTVSLPLCASRNARRPRRKGADPTALPCLATKAFTASRMDPALEMSASLSSRSSSARH